jgi:hypothetical protein
MPRLYQIPFYRNMDLADGRNAVRVVNKAPAGTPCFLDGFRVYRSHDFDPTAFYAFVNRANRKVCGSAQPSDSIAAVDSTKFPAGL